MSRRSTVKRDDPITPGMSERDIARALGVSRTFLWKCRQLAAIPEDEFEAAMKQPGIKRTDSLIDMARHRATLRRCPNCGHILSRVPTPDVEGSGR